MCIRALKLILIVIHRLVFTIKTINVKLKQSKGFGVFEMSRNVKNIKKIGWVCIIPTLIAFAVFCYYAFYMNGKATEMKSIQDFAKIYKAARLVKDSNTLAIIEEAKSDDLITRKELKTIKESFARFERDISSNIKPAEQREKEFMERMAKYLAETNSTNITQ